MAGPRRLSRCSALIVVMKSSDFRELNHSPHRRPMQRTLPGTIHFQREMRPPALVVRRIRLQHPPQVSLVQDDNVIKAPLPDATESGARCTGSAMTIPPQ